MKKEMINKTHIEGLVYDHKLTKKVSGPNSKILVPSLFLVNSRLPLIILWMKLVPYLVRV